jgi:hypothetical protein
MAVAPRAPRNPCLLHERCGFGRGGIFENPGKLRCDTPWQCYCESVLSDKLAPPKPETRRDSRQKWCALEGAKRANDRPSVTPSGGLHPITASSFLTPPFAQPSDNAAFGPSKPFRAATLASDKVIISMKPRPLAVRPEELRSDPACSDAAPRVVCVCIQFFSTILEDLGDRNGGYRQLVDCPTVPFAPSGGYLTCRPARAGLPKATSFGHGRLLCGVLFSARSAINFPWTKTH